MSSIASFSYTEYADTSPLPETARRTNHWEQDAHFDAPGACLRRRRGSAQHPALPDRNTKCGRTLAAKNQWLGGEPYWRGVQLGEAAYPVLLAALLAGRGPVASHRLEQRAACDRRRDASGKGERVQSAIFFPTVLIGRGADAGDIAERPTDHVVGLDSLRHPGRWQTSGTPIWKTSPPAAPIWQNSSPLPAIMSARRRQGAFRRPGGAR